MNVTSVGGPVSPAPVVATASTGRPATELPVLGARRHREGHSDAANPAADAAARAAEQRQVEEKLPPLKPLSTAEIRMILGGIPPIQPARRAGTGAPAGTPEPGSTLDTYA